MNILTPNIVMTFLYQAIAMLRAAILPNPLPLENLHGSHRATALEDMFVRVLFPLIDTTLHLHTALASTRQPERRLTYVYKLRGTGVAEQQPTCGANEAQLRSLLLVSDVLEQVT